MSKSIRFYSPTEEKELKKLIRKTPPQGISAAVKIWAAENNRPFTGAYNKLLRLGNKVGKRKKKRGVYKTKPKGLVVHHTSSTLVNAARFSIQRITFTSNVMTVEYIPIPL